MKKALLLFTIISIALAQAPSSEYLYLDILSDFTAQLPNRNPAYLSSENIPYSYAFQYSYSNRAGDYKLPFTPGAKYYQNLEVSAYQEMDNGILFAGRFAYRSELRQNKLWLHNAETNIDIPFYFADSTTGDFNLNGIDWNIIFSYPLGKSTRIAVDIFYNVDEQFKSVFPKPNSKRNNLHVRPAISFKSERSSLGLMGSYFQFKENIQTKKYSLEQGRSPIFMRIRGLDRSLLTYAETNEERLQNIQGFGFSANFDLIGRLLGETNYEHSQAQITDGGSHPVEQGNWDMTRFYYRVDLKSTVTSFLNADLFFKQYWSNATGYHPTLNAQIYASSNRHFEGGVALPYHHSANESWAGSVSYSFQDIKREDNFLGLLHYIPGNTLHLNMNYTHKRKGVLYEFNCGYNDVRIGENIVYDTMSDWYYEMITAEEIAYYATDREEIEAGLKVVFPFRDMKIALTGTYKELRPINTETRYHLMQTQIEIMF
ncbi:MAG: hypothetical protein KAU44_03135 [Candidatus Marinimicrobia bacterium]|nr:hypothetical protein [Candidatus Neomarinimicrobiota bacterium]